jgi:glutamate-1-semialdehyde 2,1-aminomutase
LLVEIGTAVTAGMGVYLTWQAPARLQLVRAKHPSLQGHPRLARRVSRLIPFYQHTGDAFFACDGAPAAIAARRRAGFEALAAYTAETYPESVALGQELANSVADADFVDAHRVPFPFRQRVRQALPLTNVIKATEGNRVRDADGNWLWDLTGSYGMNVLGHEAYRECLARGADRAREAGPFLGGYHPVVADNAERLQWLSGLDNVSFHMSGTEAVMQAVRLARYHTGRRRIVRFAGAYHGWWDGVQAGVGSQRRADDLLTLRDVDNRSLRVLQSRRDIAAVLVSPLQILHPNRAAPGDATLVGSRPASPPDRTAYTKWLKRLRQVCEERGIVLIFDEVFSGFRLGAGGAQAYFGICADLVTYGKTLGGGLPVGVLCGQRALMKRFDDDRPANICFARGTFNAHPSVMTCMNEFLKRLQTDGPMPSDEAIHSVWDARTSRLNHRLAQHGLPLEAANISSIITLGYTKPSRYNWMFQFYLRQQGLALSWTGTGRLIFSHDYTEADFDAVIECILAAGETMRADGWWWHPQGQTDKRINRQILGEMARAKIGKPTAN